MLRIFNSVIRGSLHPSWCAVIPNQRTQYCGLKQSIEEKLNIPPKPKRPLSPFFRFMNETRPAIKQKYPNALSKEISKLIGKEWDAVDPNVKVDLQNSFRKDFNHYSTELLEYNKNLTAEQHSAIQDAKAQIVLASNKRKLKRKCKLLGRPTKPKTTFLMFLEDNKLSRGTMDVKNWVLSMVPKWQQLDEREKQQYTDKMKINMAKYAEDLKTWEVEMIKSGQDDVVRRESQIARSRPPVKDRK